MTRGRKPLAFWLLCLFVVASGAYTITAWQQLETGRQATLEESRRAAVQAASHMVRDINEEVQRLEVAATRLLAEIDGGTLTVDNAWERMCAQLGSDTALALTIGWLPGHVPPSIAFDGDDAVYFRSGYLDDDACETYEGRYDIAEVVDETRGRISAWYDVPAATGRPNWFGEPYFSPVSQRYWCCGYSVPFFVDGEVAGVVAAELMARSANRVLFSAESSAFSDLPDDASYGMLISREGLILSHPDPTLVAGHRRLGEFIPELADPATFRDHADPAQISGSEISDDVLVRDDVRYERSGQDLSIFLAPAGETGWWVAVILDQDAIDRGAERRKSVERLTVRMVLAAAVFGFGVLLLLSGLLLHGRTRLWVEAIAFTLICLALIGWRLDYGLDHSVKVYPGEQVLKTRATAAKEVIHFAENHDLEPTVIPTGVFVQSAEFSSANNVTVTGLLWQHFSHELPEAFRPNPDSPSPGFAFPEAETSDIELLYVREEEGRTVIGWQFRTVLRQEFDYHRYPFDLETIWIRLWPAALGEGVILTPDLEAYDTLVPEAMPGMELQDFVLGGWDIRDSYFSYRHNRYNTHFGTGEFIGQASHPELYFNIGLSRQFLNAFIMNFITLSVVAFLLFAVLFTIKPGDEAGELLGFNVSTVLGFCAALFFVVIISHTSLRQEIAAPTLVYLEYYFFALYVAFLGVSVNAILAGSRRPPEWIRSGQNVYARLLFWPLLSATLLVVTLFIFD